MRTLSSEQLKNQILQYIIDTLPQPVIWYNMELQDIFCNFSAEDIFKISQQKNFYLENYGTIFKLPESFDPELSESTQVYEYAGTHYFKREVLAKDAQNNTAIHAIFLQRAITDSNHAFNPQHREFFERFYENSLKPIFQKISLWNYKDLDEHYRAAQLASQITEYLELSEMTQNTVFYAALLMDIGNLYVANDILNNPQDLSDIEFSMVQSHAEASYKILKNIPFETSIADIILQHHERFDGSGYPYGLREDEISLEARILGIADTLIAMTSARPHRPALSLQMSLSNLKKQSGVKFDPRITQVCIELLENQPSNALFTSQIHQA